MPFRESTRVHRKRFGHPQRGRSVNRRGCSHLGRGSAARKEAIPGICGGTLAGVRRPAERPFPESVRLSWSGFGHPQKCRRSRNAQPWRTWRDNTHGTARAAHAKWDKTGDPETLAPNTNNLDWRFRRPLALPDHPTGQATRDGNKKRETATTSTAAPPPNHNTTRANHRQTNRANNK